MQKERTFWGRYRLLANKEIVIDRLNRGNIFFLLFILLILVPCHILLKLCTLGHSKGINFNKWFVYEYSLMNNTLYDLYAENNLLMNRVLENHEKCLVMKENIKRSVTFLEKSTSREEHWCSEWMYIPESEAKLVGRKDPVEPLYLKALSSKVLNKFQTGRKYPEYDTERDVIPPSEVGIFVNSNGDESINRSFIANKEELGADYVVGYKKPDDKSKDSGGVSRKKQKNESDQAHGNRLRAMDSGTFDPKKWDWQEGKPK